MIRRILITLAFAIGALAMTSSAAQAGSPHFVSNTVAATQDGATLTVTFKEAGLGDEPQVHVVLTADAQCVNPGGNNPQAGNKQSVSTAGDFPVQNGKTEGALSVTASFTPSCSPPMSVVYSDVVLTDVTSGISVTL
jgi:uncharacterized cupredoxin-like copper-binding protein